MTVSKFEIFSGIPKFLQETFDLDLLPRELGGNNELVVPYPLDSKKFKEEYVLAAGVKED